MERRSRRRDKMRHSQQFDFLSTSCGMSESFDFFCGAGDEKEEPLSLARCSRDVTLTPINLYLEIFFGLNTSCFFFLFKCPMIIFRMKCAPGQRSPCLLFYKFLFLFFSIVVY